MKKDVVDKANKIKNTIDEHMKKEGLDPENSEDRKNHYKKLKIDEENLGSIAAGISRAFGNYVSDDEAEVFIGNCEAILKKAYKDII